MGLTRRGLFAAMPAAVAAAPEIAKEMANTMSGEAMGMKYPSAMLDKPAMDWEALDRARRIASGDVRQSDFDKMPSTGHHHVEPRAELKSVSPRARVFMARVEAERQTRAHIIERAKEALLEYDKTGLIKFWW